MSSKSDDFSLRYGDITIFKMAAVRYLGIVLPPYETHYEVSVAGRSCLSNFIFDLNAYSGLQMGGFRELWTHKCDYS